jgi:hypothetical protein
VVTNQTARATGTAIPGPFEREFLCGATGVLPRVAGWQPAWYTIYLRGN